jgi:hypothetical protein
MFNAMEPEDLVLALGRVLRSAADFGGDFDDYQRSQLLSGYSVARHLAAEQSAQAALLSWFQEELAEMLHDVEIDPVLRERLVHARTGAQLGNALAELLDQLPEDPVHTAFRTRLHAAFAEMADREVAALADAGS